MRQFVALRLVDFCFSLYRSELMFLETSAVTGENVEEAFLKCSRSILTKIEAGRMLSPLLIMSTMSDFFPILHC